MIVDTRELKVLAKEAKVYDLTMSGGFFERGTVPGDAYTERLIERLANALIAALDENDALHERIELLEKVAHTLRGMAKGKK